MSTGDADAEIARAVADSLARASSCSSGDFSAGSLNDLATAWISPLAAAAADAATRSPQAPKEDVGGAHTLATGGAGIAVLSSLLRNALGSVAGVDPSPYVVPPAHWYISLASLANERLAREHETASAETSLIIVRGMAEQNQLARRRIRHERDMTVSVLASLLGLPSATDAVGVIAPPRSSGIPIGTLRTVLSPLLPSAAPEMDAVSAASDRSFADAVATIAMERPRDVFKVVWRFLLHSMRLLPAGRSWAPPPPPTAAPPAGALAGTAPPPPPPPLLSADGGLGEDPLARARGLLAVVECAAEGDAGVAALDVVRRLSKVAGNHSTGAKLSALRAVLGQLHGYCLQTLEAVGTMPRGGGSFDAASEPDTASSRTGESEGGAASDPAAVSASPSTVPSRGARAESVESPLDFAGLSLKFRGGVAEGTGAPPAEGDVFARAHSRPSTRSSSALSDASLPAAMPPPRIVPQPPSDAPAGPEAQPPQLLLLPLGLSRAMAQAAVTDFGSVSLLFARGLLRKYPWLTAVKTRAPPPHHPTAAAGGGGGAAQSAASGARGSPAKAAPPPSPTTTTTVDYSRLVLNVTREALANALHAQMLAAFLQAEREEDAAWTRVRGGGEGSWAQQWSPPPVACLTPPPSCSPPPPALSQATAALWHTPPCVYCAGHAFCGVGEPGCILAAAAPDSSAPAPARGTAALLWAQAYAPAAAAMRLFARQRTPLGKVSALRAALRCLAAVAGAECEAVRVASIPGGSGGGSESSAAAAAASAVGGQKQQQHHIGADELIPRLCCLLVRAGIPGLVPQASSAPCGGAMAPNHPASARLPSPAGVLPGGDAARRAG